MCVSASPDLYLWVTTDLVEWDDFGGFMHRQRTTGVACGLVLVLASSLGASERVWRDVESAFLRGPWPDAGMPAQYRTVELDAERLEAVLSLAQLEGVAGPTVRPVIELPLPDGSFGRFRVELSPVMAPGLAARFPEIRTFRGSGIDDPTAVVRFDLTLKGFHGMILSAGETVFINPHPRGGGGLYVSFERGAAVASAKVQFNCRVEDEQLAGHGVVPVKNSGPVLRTYRTAIAATGEYTEYHGGTTADALSAIVVVMNRINGIFRREVSVAFELVDDNDRVIFTDPETDPYTNDDTSAIILENQATLDSVIGFAGYDHGHVFHTHLGGRAGGFGTPCNHFYKGQGVSGLRVPEGEVFMVDLVAHEMGHQLGAAHTYNSLERTCVIARNEWAAYEPGSGSTIMSYAGVCGSENIQAHSDDYFHGFSLDEIGGFLSGSGATCGSVTQTGNQPPDVDAGPGATIPAQTPFTLVGSGSDASPLTFTWEQFDLGPPSPPMSDDGLRPLFRSHLPAAGAWRVFPPLNEVLHGGSSPGEALPTTTRRLTFRLTARDGEGGVGHDTKVLQVDGAAGPFQVTAPRVGDRWAAGERATVEWDVAGTDAGPVACGEVEILLSADDGEIFDEILAESTPNDGIEEVAVPQTASAHARVMIACSDNIFFAVSPRYSVVWWRTRQPGGRIAP